MEYEGQICRAPMERSAYMLPVSVSCSYNRCLFCGLFKHLTYRELPLSQIEAELQRVAKLGAKPKRVFLGDGTAFALSQEHLKTILELIHEILPSVEQIRMDATVSSVLSRSNLELLELKRQAVDCLYLGIESGLDDVLSFMQKDHSVAEAHLAVQRLEAAGIHYAAHIMSGVAGRGRGLENARASAAFLNQSQPQSLVNFSMFLHHEVPLYQEIEKGRFVPADELENLREARQLIELLNPRSPLQLDSMHDAVQFRVRGSLPHDRERILAQLDAAIAEHPHWADCYAWADEPTDSALN